MKAHFHGLTMDKLEDAYDHYLHCLCFDEIKNRLFDNDYLKNKGIEDLSDEEIEIATDILRQDIGTRIDEDIDWGLCAMYAIDDVIAKRPPKEEQKSIVPTLYGLDWNQMTNVYHAVDTHFMRGEVANTFKDCFYDEKLTADELNAATTFAIDIRDDRVEYSDIARDAIKMVIDGRVREPKEPPKDLLNDTLKLIGLETHTYFRIDDQEFKDQILSIDSFGDVFAVDDEYVNDFLSQQEWSDHEHEYLTLGRILTQYPDKIVRDLGGSL